MFQPTESHVDLDEPEFLLGEALLLIKEGNDVDLIGIEEQLAANEFMETRNIRKGKI